MALFIKFCTVVFSLVILTAGSVPTLGQEDAVKSLAAGIPVGGRSVVMGTWYWDLESNKQGMLPTSDLWWQQVDGVQQFLVPLGPVGITVLENKDFDSLGYDDLKGLRYGRCPIENVILQPGTVLAVRTAEGNFAKVRVVGYRDMHDLSFDDARYGRQSWFAYLHTKPNKLNYHLEVDWAVFPKNGAAQF